MYPLPITYFFYIYTLSHPYQPHLIYIIPLLPTSIYIPYHTPPHLTLYNLSHSSPLYFIYLIPLHPTSLYIPYPNPPHLTLYTLSFISLIDRFRFRFIAIWKIIRIRTYKRIANLTKCKRIEDCTKYCFYPNPDCLL